MNMKRISYITTVDHNVGDDFVREGITWLLKQTFKTETVTFENIHKHAPVTVRKGFEKLRYYPLALLVDTILPLNEKNDRILSSDILVQSGAPVYWCHEGITHCADNEWYRPLIRRRFLKNKNRKLFLNIAAGTCQQYHSDGSEFFSCKKDQAYIRELFSISDITTLRDALAKKVLNGLGLDAPLIPCSSIFAADNNNMHALPGEFVSLNFMSKAGHYTFGQKYDPAQWFKTFSEFYSRIKKHERCIFVCHNQEEIADAKKIDPEAEVFFSHDYRDYIKYYAKAKFGIMNRVHGAFIIASYGRPSFVIGSDTRARMTQEIGLTHEFVGDVDLDRLLHEYGSLQNNPGYAERFTQIKQKAHDDYMSIFRSLQLLSDK
jgi:hypothetical protein